MLQSSIRGLERNESKIMVSIKKLFEGTKDTDKKYRDIISCIYPFAESDLNNCDVIFFTSPWDWDIEKKAEYIEKIHIWMLEKYKNKSIFIKKHPRDNEEYNWDDLCCKFLQESIPAEIIAERINKSQEVVMMGASTILLSLLSRNSNVHIFKFGDIHGEYERNMKEKIKLLKLEDTIVYL